jgi:hypothetical protein
MGWEPTHRPSTTVEQPGLPSQGLPVPDDTNDVTAAAPKAAGRHDENLALVTEDLTDLPAKAPGGVSGVHLSLDHDPAPDDVEAAGEAQGRRHFGLATAGFGDL